MSFSNYKNLSFFLTISEIEEEIFSLKKFLLELKFQAVGKKIKNNHLCRLTKRKIAQLSFKKSILEKEKSK